MQANIDLIQQTYDSQPYLSLPFPHCAPERIAAIAHVFGLSAPDPATARVLELGCAAGGNLIPYAARNRDAKALGVDLSGRQVADGQDMIQSLGLDNIRLKRGDIAGLAELPGTFDYVICHGVYSWVPAHVRDAIMRICERQLSPNGIAYISYNTYPGWKAKEVIRDAMLFRSVGQQDPRLRLQAGKSMIDFLGRSVAPDSIIAKIIGKYAPTVRDGRDDYVAHEFLEPNNLPCYFHDFLAHAADHGLAYLADAQVATMFATNLPPEVAGPLLKEYGGDQRQLEQCMDFIGNREFRQTLLFREGLKRNAGYRLDDRRLRGLHYAADLPCLDGAVSYDARPQRFGSMSAHVATLATPVFKAAAVLLTEAWPATLSVEAMAAGIGERIGAPPVQVEPELLQFLAMLVRRGIGAFRLQPMAGSRKAGPRPLVPAITRRHAALLAASGNGGHVFNDWHEPIMLDAVSMEILPLLDGTHGIDDMLAALRRAAGTGGPHGPAAPAPAAAASDAELRRRIDDFLVRLEDMKLLQ
jgi:SAM-dependent methyltransferase